jgi:hypothetical protein
VRGNALGTLIASSIVNKEKTIKFHKTLFNRGEGREEEESWRM